MSALLEVRNLAVDFLTDEGPVPAVRDVSFTVEQGVGTGLIGESGCGKSVTSLAVMDLLPPSARVIRGQILFQGQDLLTLSRGERARLRGRRMSMVFQDAISALNPVFPIGEQMKDILRAAGAGQHPDGPGEDERVCEMLARVGIASPERRMRQYPHELSGGMRQRVLIAMALLCQPQLIIADEPTTALDVTTETQIIALIRTVVAQFDVTLLLITHNLSLVAELCDHSVVIYRGHTVEEADTSALFARPLHPYTRGLLASVLTFQTPRGQLRPIGGSVPNPREKISGCQFRPRCPHVMSICAAAPPPFQVIEPGHPCACFLTHAKEDP